MTESETLSQPGNALYGQVVSRRVSCCYASVAVPNNRTKWANGPESKRVREGSGVAHEHYHEEHRCEQVKCADLNWKNVEKKQRSEGMYGTSRLASLGLGLRRKLLNEIPSFHAMSQCAGTIQKLFQLHCCTACSVRQQVRRVQMWWLQAQNFRCCHENCREKPIEK